CMRLSTFAANVIAKYLESGDPSVLTAYSGAVFRARFVSRLWMRRLLATIHSPFLIEAGCAILRQAPFETFARHVFFGRGSFPDVSDKAQRDALQDPVGP